MSIEYDEGYKQGLADALAQQKQEQEPFGYFQLDLRLDAWVQNRVNNKGVAFYTTPPRREWVGLTDKEIAEVGKLWVEGERMLPFAFASAIEAKLKEKNT